MLLDVKSFDVDYSLGIIPPWKKWNDSTTVSGEFGLLW
jgi:hypothetical protein